MEQESAYELDNLITEFLETQIPEEKLTTIYNIFNLLKEFNLLDGYLINIDIDTFNDKLVNLITGNDNLGTELLDLIMVRLTKFFVRSLKELGIIVVPDIEFYLVEGILSGYYTVLTIDQRAKSEVVEILNRDGGWKSKLIDLLTRYTDILTVDLVELVQDVDPVKLEYVLNKYERDIDIEVADLPEDMLVRIQKLYQSDIEFLRSNYIAYVMRTGRQSTKKLYKILDQATIPECAYEIYAYYMLSPDIKNIVQRYQEELRIENLASIGNDTAKQESLRFAVQAIDNKLRR